MQTREPGQEIGTSPWRAEAETVRADIVRWRRYLHQHPEVSFKEFETTEYLAQELAGLGLAPVRKTPTGLWVDIDGFQPGRTVMVRCDIDALPVAEATGLPFASENQGVMHACGHDTHMAMALGAAEVLSRVRDRIRGRVRVLFQPAEETPPGGAPQMIEAGVLEGVDAAIGLHVGTLHSQGVSRTGYAYLGRGAVMAASGRFFLTIHGKGGHGSAPHMSVDAIAVAGEVLSALQHVVARHVDPMKQAVVTVGTIHGGFNQNVIAPEVEMTGTVRMFDMAVEPVIESSMRRIVTRVAEAFGARAEFRYESGYPVVVNHPEVTEVMRSSAVRVLGAEHVEEGQPLMGSEDFAYYAQHVPSAFLWLGMGNPDVAVPMPNHDPHMIPDEDGLPLGTAILLETTFRLLDGGV